MSRLRYRIQVGVYIWTEYTPHPSQSSAEIHQLLGNYVADAASEGRRIYGPHHEVRVTIYEPCGPTA